MIDADSKEEVDDFKEEAPTSYHQLKGIDICHHCPQFEGVLRVCGLNYASVNLGVLLLMN